MNVVENKDESQAGRIEKVTMRQTLKVMSEGVASEAPVPALHTIR
jgi:hypothetical protein